MKREIKTAHNMPLLVLLRHGESMWNPPKKKASSPAKGWRYAGAMDVPLSEDGIQDAIEAGHRLKSLPFDVVYCSMLMRAQMTALIALASHDSEQTPLIVRDNPDKNSPRGLRAEHLSKMLVTTPANEEETSGENESETNAILPVYCSNSLNERDFGELQGMHSRMQKRLYTPQQLELWRCAWDEKFPGTSGESSKQVYERVVTFFNKHVKAKLEQGKNVMIVAHGFVQRVMIKHLIQMSDEDWSLHMKLESSHDPIQKRSSKLLAQNAVPVIFTYTNGKAKRVDSLVQDAFAEEDEGQYHKTPTSKL
jgi:2,3-bisphosphoglycerate-dependent phosphoglycerate mutase